MGLVSKPPKGLVAHLGCSGLLSILSLSSEHNSRADGLCRCRPAAVRAEEAASFSITGCICIGGGQGGGEKPALQVEDLLPFSKQKRGHVKWHLVFTDRPMGPQGPLRGIR